RDFARYYRQCSEKIHALVDPLSDDQIWTKPYPYGNSIGHLLLHLTGNLSYYIGAEIGGSGYVRNRPLEFSDSTRHPKATLLGNFDVAIAVEYFSLATTFLLRCAPFLCTDRSSVRCGATNGRRNGEKQRSGFQQTPSLCLRKAHPSLSPSVSAVPQRQY